MNLQFIIAMNILYTLFVWFVLTFLQTPDSIPYFNFMLYKSYGHMMKYIK